MTKKEKLEKYFERIGLKYEEPYEPNLEHLIELHLAHNYTIPYENLDLLKGKKLSLDYDDLYEKFIINKRGGYCFEVNGLFGWLLRELGYNVTDYLGRYCRGETLEVPMRRHRILKVELPEGNYLADVGIGDKAQRYPLKMVEGVEQKDVDDIYKFEKDDFYGWKLMEKLPDGSWGVFFTFTEEPQAPTDFEMPSFWCERHPDSAFWKIPIFCLKAERGMVTLLGDTFRDSRGGVLIEERELKTDEEKAEVYKKYFNLEY